MGGYGGVGGLGGVGKRISAEATGIFDAVWGEGVVMGDGGEIKIISQSAPLIVNDVGINPSVKLYKDATIRPTRASEAAFARRVSHDSSV